MVPLNIRNYRLAKDLKISAGRVNNIVNEKCGIGPDTAARLSVYFNTTVEFWLGLQIEYDLQCISDELKKTVEKEIRGFCFGSLVN